jgi:SAM-dependent methyltransferase
MSSNNTDKDWENFASTDPYWAVLTQDRFRKQAMDEAARREFFLSGEKYIEWVFSVIHKHIDPQFKPEKGLDFGCGVGRLVLAMSRRCRSVVGIDVSDSMLAEARKNCVSENAGNVEVVKGDDNCSNLKPGFDFLNSVIVLQHIPCERGILIFRRLIDLMTPEAVGAVHFTYSGSGFPMEPDASRYGARKKKEPSRGGKYHLSQLFRALKERGEETFQRAPSQAEGVESKSPVPEMQMNPYLLNPIFQILQEAGVREMHVAFSDHTRSLGTVLFFKKGAASYAFPSLKE